MVQTEALEIENRNKGLKEIGEIAIKKSKEDRDKRNKILNKHKLTADFKVGDIVFSKDRKIIQGSTRPLKTLYSFSPYEISKVMATTAEVRRLSDGFTQVYHLNDLKKYVKDSPMFKDLPESVLSILDKNINHSTISKHDLEKIQKLSPIDFPDGLVELDDENNEINTDQEDWDDSDEEMSENITVEPPLENKIEITKNEDNASPPNDPPKITKYNLRPRSKNPLPKIKKWVRFKNT